MTSYNWMTSFPKKPNCFIIRGVHSIAKGISAKLNELKYIQRTESL